MVKGGGSNELGFEQGDGVVGVWTVEGAWVMFEGISWLLKILVMVGGDGGGRGRVTVEMPRLLKFYY